MNPLQTGTPSSQLEPQGFQNSAQKSDFQDTLSSSNVQQSSSSVLQVPASGTLQVVSAPPNNSVLGTTSTAQATTGSGVSGLAVFLVIASAVVAAAFFLRYKRLTKRTEEVLDEGEN